MYFEENPYAYGPGGAKGIGELPMFRIALEQDRRVLTSASRNATFWPNATPLVGPLDFLQRSIEAILAGALPPAAETPETAYIEL